MKSTIKGNQDSDYYSMSVKAEWSSHLTVWCWHFQTQLVLILLTTRTGNEKIDWMFLLVITGITINHASVYFISTSTVLWTSLNCVLSKLQWQVSVFPSLTYTHCFFLIEIINWRALPSVCVPENTDTGPRKKPRYRRKQRPLHVSSEKL